MAARILLLVAVVYTLLITTLSLVRLGPISVGSFHPTDKLMHAAAYFGLAAVWFLFYLFKTPNDLDLKKGFLKIAMLVIGFGMLIEVLQGVLTSYRQPDLADVVANSIGVLLALGLFIGFSGFLKNVKRYLSSFL